jgi:hypothetical protein
VAAGRRLPWLTVGEWIREKGANPDRRRQRAPGEAPRGTSLPPIARSCGPDPRVCDPAQFDCTIYGIGEDETGGVSECANVEGRGPVRVDFRIRGASSSENTGPPKQNAAQGA